MNAQDPTNIWNENKALVMSYSDYGKNYDYTLQTFYSQEVHGFPVNHLQHLKLHVHVMEIYLFSIEILIISSSSAVSGLRHRLYITTIFTGCGRWFKPYPVAATICY